MAPAEVLAWLLVAQLALSAIGLALLGVAVWKARALVDSLTRAVDGLTKAAAGADWKAEKLAEAFAQIATSVELSATAAAASSVAIQTIARELRPVIHGRAEVHE